MYLDPSGVPDLQETFLIPFALQLLVLFCCVAAGNEPYSQFLSDEEQVEYLAHWKKEHGDK